MHPMSRARPLVYASLHMRGRRQDFEPEAVSVWGSTNGFRMIECCHAMKIAYNVGDAVNKTTGHKHQTHSPPLLAYNHREELFCNEKPFAAASQVYWSLWKVPWLPQGDLRNLMSYESFWVPVLVAWIDNLLACFP